MDLLRVCALTFLILAVAPLAAHGKRKERRKRRRFENPLLNTTLSPEKMELIRKSWFTLFQNQNEKATQRSENEVQDRKSKKERKRSNKKSWTYGPITNPGPRGPPGPPGPPGPSGARVTHNELMKEFRTIIQATADRRVKRFGSNQKISFLAAGIPDVLSAFTVELAQNVVVTKKTFAFLRGFHQGRPGSFIRGSGLDLISGRFVAPYTAVYRFESTLHIVRPIRSARLKPHNAVTGMICINGDCHNNLALKFRTGIMTNSKAFSIAVSGHLYLERYQYVEVVVENTASNKITVLSDSTFSGCLVGA